MTATLPAPAPVVAPTGRADRCRNCRMPYGDWDACDVLWRPDSVDCPVCTHAAIAEDAAFKRLDDA